jgi:hypothetical protein
MALENIVFFVVIDMKINLQKIVLCIHFIQFATTLLKIAKKLLGFWLLSQFMDGLNDWN